MRLVSWFTPPVTRLRGLHQLTPCAPVQARFGLRRPALGALRDAAAVCDAAWWPEVLTALRAHRQPHLAGAEPAARAALPAVAGRRVPAVPRLRWAVWQADQHRAATRPGACAVLRQGPVDVTVTAGHASERAAWRRWGPPGGVSVFARGASDDDRCQALPDLPCRFLGRVKTHGS